MSGGKTPEEIAAELAEMESETMSRELEKAIRSAEALAEEAKEKQRVAEETEKSSIAASNSAKEAEKAAEGAFLQVKKATEKADSLGITKGPSAPVVPVTNEKKAQNDAKKTKDHDVAANEYADSAEKTKQGIIGESLKVTEAVNEIMSSNDNAVVGSELRKAETASNNISSAKVVSKNASTYASAEAFWAAKEANYSLVAATYALADVKAKKKAEDSAKKNAELSRSLANKAKAAASPPPPKPPKPDFPYIQPTTVLEITPFANWDGTFVGNADIIKEKKGESTLSALSNGDNFLYRLEKSVLNDLYSPTKEELGKNPLAKKKNYNELFPGDIEKKHKKIQIITNPPQMSGGSKKRRRSKSAKKRTIRKKINKK